MLERAKAGLMNGGEGSGEVVPGEYAIAHHLIKAWVDGFSFEAPTSIAPAAWSHLLTAAAGVLAGAAVALFGKSRSSL